MADINHQSDIDLPKPQYEAMDANAPEQVEETEPKKAEQASLSAELPQSGQASEPPTAGLPAVPPPVPVSVDDPDLSASPVSVNSPTVAEDNDLIEQEWVSKAKAIVDRTKMDPHQQNKEINKFKADYIKKRYNREIKVTEE